MSLLRNTMPDSPKRIAVAMSGGVDSSVVAYLLAQQGHELVGFTAWTLNGPGKCCNDALVNAGRVCEMLNIPYDTVDLRAEFSHYVMDYYHNAYEAGLTPNPCVECNRYVKWEKMVAYARETYNVDYVATGHYSRIDRSGDHIRLFRGEDHKKDQTYMMARTLPQDLEYALFPLGDLVKPQVVELAHDVGLPTAHSKESQDICFVLDGQANYMKGVFGSKPGPIVDVDTDKVVGEHEGYFQYTVGQRKGVKVAAGRPIYVIKLDPKTNTVYVGDSHHLETNTFRVRQIHWLRKPSALPFESMVKFRYNTPASLATVSEDPQDENSLLVEFSTPVMAITPGQIAAFYDTDFMEIFGGGYIEKFLAQPEFDPTIERDLPNLFCHV